MTRFVGKKIRAKLFVVTVSQHFRAQVTGARKLLNVVAIPLKIPFQFGEGYIVRFEAVKPQMFPAAREHRHEPLFVIFGRCGHGNGVKVKPVLPVERRTLSGNVRQVALLGMTHRKSISLVVRATPYSCVTTKPPQQCKSTSSASRASTSAKKDRHGSGGWSVCRIG